MGSTTMSRKANYTDQELDDCIADFFDREGRKPKYSEIREMCPLGVSNDRVSSALSRAEDRVGVPCKADGADNKEVPTASLGVFQATFEEICQELETLRQKARRLETENSKLRASQERILARRSADIAKAVEEVREEAEGQLNAMARAFFRAKLED
jgi:regulator of replication initiation timing